MFILDIDISEARSSHEIDKEFDQIIVCVEARRKVLKEQLQEKSKVWQEIRLYFKDLLNCLDMSW